MSTFAIPNETNAEIAQLVEHNLAKVGVASSSLVFRSKTKEVSRNADLLFENITRRGTIICQSSLCTRSAFLFANAGCFAFMHHLPSELSCASITHNMYLAYCYMGHFQ